jgi:hypothetical protein
MIDDEPTDEAEDSRCDRVIELAEGALIAGRYQREQLIDAERRHGLAVRATLRLDLHSPSVAGVPV